MFHLTQRRYALSKSTLIVVPWLLNTHLSRTIHLCSLLCQTKMKLVNLQAINVCFWFEEEGLKFSMIFIKK